LAPDSLARYSFLPSYDEFISEDNDRSILSGVFARRLEVPGSSRRHGTIGTRDGKPNLAAPAPRAADGKPHLSGVRMKDTTSRTAKPCASSSVTTRLFFFPAQTRAPKSQSNVPVNTKNAC